MKTIGKWLLLMLVGGCAVYASQYLFTDESMEVISGLLLGIGSVLVALGLGNIVYALWLNQPGNRAIHEGKLKAARIESKDERRIRINEKAGWKTNQIIFYLLLAVTVCFSLMQVEPIVVTVLSGVFVFQIGLGMFMANHYAKRM
ncbi:hypothetical protein PA598K_00771 [Paenibacillus sp. 598K]|uniref:hypothetical protein n=1 Tax=Paenibacillus sp. 598K TaxID=1117987 RepID=UPI000FFA3991|nr:hypothetical protein [Paenibacillus sp. 598K]GBF72515.1 hypothetical protein PA598K_00771 [Paenibacillus sp. 598K]